MLEGFVLKTKTANVYLRKLCKIMGLFVSLNTGTQIHLNNILKW